MTDARRPLVPPVPRVGHEGVSLHARAHSLSAHPKLRRVGVDCQRPLRVGFCVALARRAARPVVGPPGYRAASISLRKVRAAVRRLLLHSGSYSA